MIRHESEVFGFVLSVHPLELYSHILKRIRYVRAKDLVSRIGQHVTTIGWHITGKTVKAGSGEPMKFVSLEDPTGLYETVFFPDAYKKFCHMLNAERPYILRGKVEENRGAITMTVDWIGFLDREECYRRSKNL